MWGHTRVMLVTRMTLTHWLCLLGLPQMLSRLSNVNSRVRAVSPSSFASQWGWRSGQMSHKQPENSQMSIKSQ